MRAISGGTNTPRARICERALVGDLEQWAALSDLPIVGATIPRPGDAAPISIAFQACVALREQQAWQRCAR